MTAAASAARSFGSVPGVLHPALDTIQPAMAHTSGDGRALLASQSGASTTQKSAATMKEKLAAVPGEAVAAAVDFTARDALIELGWTLADAERVLADVDEDLPVEEQVRQALRKAA